jgi:Uma2 family endonuclease
MRAVVSIMPPHWLNERKTSGADQWDEVWEGVLHVAPVANRSQQNLELSLQCYLLTFWAKPSGCRVNQQVNLTTPEDEENWRDNYRIPDLVLLKPKNFHIDKIEYMVGAPDVVVEIHSPGDESYEKLPFYAGLGVPEVWIIDRDKKTPEVYRLQEDGTYKEKPAEADGWHRSVAINVEMKRGKPGKLAVRLKGKPRTKQEIPE